MSLMLIPSMDFLAFCTTVLQKVKKTREVIFCVGQETDNLFVNWNVGRYV